MTNILKNMKEKLSSLKTKKENPPIDIQIQEKNQNFIQRLKDFWQSKKWIFILLVIGIAIIGIIIYRYYLTIQVFSEYKTLSVSETTDVKNSKYKAYGEYIIRYSLDGISCRDKKGNLIWEQAYEIKSPIINICEDYVAVAAQRGNIIYIFNKSGYQGEIATLYPIVNIKVAVQGVVAVVMEDAGTNYVNLYDVNGTELTTKKTSLEGNGYPFAIGLSQDGMKLIISSLNITNNQVETAIECFNFSDVGQNMVDKLMGIFHEYKNSLIPKIEFLNNNIFCAFANDQIILFYMKERPEVKVEIPLPGEMKTVFYDNKYIGVIISDEEDALYRLFVYDLNGNTILEEQIYQEFQDIYFWGNNVVLYDSYDCQIIGLDGKIRFDYTFEHDILLLKPISYSRFVWVSSSFISEIQLK